MHRKYDPSLFSDPCEPMFLTIWLPSSVKGDFAALCEWYAGYLGRDFYIEDLASTVFGRYCYRYHTDTEKFLNRYKVKEVQQNENQSDR